MKTDYFKYSYKYCGGTWMFCDGKCKHCLHSNTITLNKTILTKQNVSFTNTTGKNKFDEELEVEPKHGETTYSY